MKRFLKAYCAWASASEGNFLEALIFGGLGAVTIVLVVTYLCPLSRYCGFVVLEYVSYVAGALTGLMGGTIVAHVQKYRKDHPEL